MSEKKKKLFDTSHKQQTAVLIGIINQRQSEEQTKEYLDELAFLAQTAGVKVSKNFVQRISSPDSRTFIGSGKLQEVKTYVTENNIDLVIFDDELSPAQIKNIQKELEKKNSRPKQLNS